MCSILDLIFQYFSCKASPFLFFKSNIILTVTNFYQGSQKCNFIHLKLTLSITAFEQGGCFEETNPRLLPGQAGKWEAWMKGEDGKPNNSPATCKKFCEGFRYYGVQYTNQCFCGNNLHGDLKMMPESQCNQVCPGDASQKCGAADRMNLYEAPPVSSK